MKCEKCGYEMNYFKDYSSCGWTCPNCDWKLVTTFVNPILADETIYTLSLSPNKAPDSRAIKAVAHICACNFVAAKNMLLNGDTLKKDKAEQIIMDIKELNEYHVKFTVSPTFPYV